MIAVVIVLIRTLIDLQERTITKRLIHVPLMKPRIHTRFDRGMTFAKTAMDRKVNRAGNLWRCCYEEAPRLHISLEFVGSYRDFGFGKCITTEATHGIR
jgi:hypothetical protein